jgi:hypothetical protein
LYRWAWNSSIGAINTTVTLLGFYYFMTIRTLIEILTAIDGHDLFLLKRTMRTGDDAFE